MTTKDSPTPITTPCMKKFGIYTGNQFEHFLFFEVQCVDVLTYTVSEHFICPIDRLIYNIGVLPKRVNESKCFSTNHAKLYLCYLKDTTAKKAFVGSMNAVLPTSHELVAEVPFHPAKDHFDFIWKNL